MKIVEKQKLRENTFIRSKPGIPDVKRISCTELAGALAEFSKRYLKGLAEVFGPPDVMRGAIGISPRRLGYALRVTIDKLSLGKPIVIRITEWDDEMNLRIEGAGLEFPEAVDEVISAWRLAGFDLRGRGLMLHLSIPLASALSFVVRESSRAVFDFVLHSSYFWDK